MLVSLEDGAVRLLILYSSWFSAEVLRIGQGECESVYGRVGIGLARVG